MVNHNSQQKNTKKYRTSKEAISNSRDECRKVDSMRLPKRKKKRTLVCNSKDFVVCFFLAPRGTARNSHASSSSE